ncbi:glycosyltransferase family 25 protein [Acinetobacter higginsii]|uniref:glycosyltransferase family 25 protein n=1 Tax=Acinetobacter higginsii TaxID=70347 RepID=UPI001F4A558A|nr:glycosyltransferase family 25 protein [Acinetobacter higginsii]MCH7339008.1 glycosyltransferase family 25 protein [Acinetobacter higginsii]
MMIYVVSLEQDLKRREQISKNFPKIYKKIIYFSAIYGASLSADKYFQNIYQYHKKHQRLLTCGEVGCSLSHIQVLEKFIESGEEHALILEDDIIGTDQDIEDIFSIVKQLDKKSVLLCGGQTSNGNRNYQLGRKSHIDNVFELSQFSYSYVYGTCCYAVTRESALQILSRHSDYLKVADNWDLFFLNTPFQIYYTNILYHPDDRKNSHLQKERLRLLESMGFFQRIKSGRFFIKNFKLIKNYLIILYLFLIGYRRIR